MCPGPEQMLRSDFQSVIPVDLFNNVQVFRISRKHDKPLPWLFGAKCEILTILCCILVKTESLPTKTNVNS